MDEAVIKYYRKLLKTGFENAGKIENASFFLDSAGEKVMICGAAGDYMQLYVNISDNTIADIKYMCVCEPTANVAVEVLCVLMKGKTLEEAAAIKKETFFSYIGSDGADLQQKVNGLLALLNKGIVRYRTNAR